VRRGGPVQLRHRRHQRYATGTGTGTAGSAAASASIVIHHHHHLLLVLVLVLLVAGLCLSRSLANLTCLQSLGLSDNRLTAKALPPLLQVCPSCFARSPSG
jgi:hypothetical protein